MAVLNIQAYVDNLDLIVLPALDAEVAGLQSDLSALDVELTNTTQTINDALAAHTVQIGVVNDTAIQADTIADGVASDILGVEWNAKVYTDAEIAALRAEILAGFPGLQSTILGQAAIDAGNQVSAGTAGISAAVEAARLDALAAQASAEVARDEIIVATDEVLLTHLPALVAATESNTSIVEALELDYLAHMTDYPYPSLQIGLDTLKATIEDPFGSSIGAAFADFQLVQTSWNDATAIDISALEVTSAAQSADLVAIKTANIDLLTGTALATILTNMGATAGGNIATITQRMATLATMDGTASSFYGLKAGVGAGGAAELELVSVANPGSPVVTTARIAAQNIILDGSVSADKVDANFMSAIKIEAEQISAGFINANMLNINSVLDFPVDKSALRINKASSLDFANDGLFFGKEVTDGGSGFSMCATSIDTVADVIRGFRQSKNDGMVIYNPTILFGGEASQGFVGITLTSTTRLLDIGVGANLTAAIQAAGGGGSSGYNSPGAPPDSGVGGNGGNTVLQIYDGDPAGAGVLVDTFTALGGAGGVRQADWGTGRGTPGEASGYGAGGNGGGKTNAGSAPVATHYGAGGGGGGGALNDGAGYRLTGGGGNAGENLLIEGYDVSGFTNDAYIVVTIGAPGIGDNSTYNGGNGAAGYVKIDSVAANMVGTRKDVAIQRESVAGATNVDFFLDSTKYTDFWILLENVRPTADGQFFMRTRVKAGGSWSSGATAYAYSVLGQASNGATRLTSSDGDDRIRWTSGDVESTGSTGHGVSGTIRVFGDDAANRYPSFMGNLIWGDANAIPKYCVANCTGYRLAQQEIDAVRFSFVGADFTTGNMTLMGTLR